MTTHPEDLDPPVGSAGGEDAAGPSSPDARPSEPDAATCGAGRREPVAAEPVAAEPVAAEPVAAEGFAVVAAPDGSDTPQVSQPFRFVTRQDLDAGDVTEPVRDPLGELFRTLDGAEPVAAEEPLSLWEVDDARVGLRRRWVRGHPAVRSRAGVRRHLAAVRAVR